MAINRSNDIFIMMDELGEAILIVFDELQNDDKSSDIIDLIDGGVRDSEIKDGLLKGIVRLRELGKNKIADDVQHKIKDFLK